MNGLEAAGRWLLIAGVGLALVGGLIWLLARFFPNLNQFPGIIRIQGAGITCLFPILASIILSIFLTILLNVIARFIK